MDTPCPVADTVHTQAQATAALASAVRRSRRLHCHNCPQGPDCQQLTDIERDMIDAIHGATTRPRKPANPKGAAALRTRGAQPGNLNALKHGFYSRTFQDLEIDDLEASLTDGLNNEIQMLRVITRRVLLLAGDLSNLDTAVTTLGALGAAATRLAALLRTQHLLGADQTAETTALQEALASVVSDLCLVTP